MRVFLSLILSILFISHSKAEENCIDTAVVLLADISDSMKQHEKELQREAYYKAFTDPDIYDRISQGYCGSVMVTYAEFSENVLSITGWTNINSYETSVYFAEKIVNNASRIESENRDHYGMTTALGTAILKATEWHSEIPGYHKKVIDLSADGTSNTGISPKLVKDKIDPEIVINGLPLLIQTDFPHTLEKHFEEDIITGFGAFMVPVYKLEDLYESIKFKFIQEIG